MYDNVKCKDCGGTAIKHIEGIDGYTHCECREFSMSPHIKLWECECLKGYNQVVIEHLEQSIRDHLAYSSGVLAGADILSDRLKEVQKRVDQTLIFISERADMDCDWEVAYDMLSTSWSE